MDKLITPSWYESHRRADWCAVSSQEAIKIIEQLSAATIERIGVTKIIAAIATIMERDDARDHDKLAAIRMAIKLLVEDEKRSWILAEAKAAAGFSDAAINIASLQAVAAAAAKSTEQEQKRIILEASTVSVVTRERAQGCSGTSEGVNVVQGGNKMTDAPPDDLVGRGNRGHEAPPASITTDAGGASDDLVGRGKATGAPHSGDDGVVPSALSASAEAPPDGMGSNYPQPASTAALCPAVPPRPAANESARIPGRA